VATWRKLRRDDPYYKGWSEYREATREAYRGMKRLGAFLGAAIVLLMLNEKFQPVPTAVAGLVAAVLSALGSRMLGEAAATSKDTLELPCPRCGLPFLRGPAGENGFARRCLNCGLPKWAPRDPDT